jgi:hypothetical protein
MSTFRIIITPIKWSKKIAQTKGGKRETRISLYCNSTWDMLESKKGRGLQEKKKKKKRKTKHVRASVNRTDGPCVGEHPVRSVDFITNRDVVCFLSGTTATTGNHGQPQHHRRSPTSHTTASPFSKSLLLSPLLNINNFILGFC